MMTHATWRRMLATVLLVTGVTSVRAGDPELRPVKRPAASAPAPKPAPRRKPRPKPAPRAPEPAPTPAPVTPVTPPPATSPPPKPAPPKPRHTDIRGRWRYRGRSDTGTFEILEQDPGGRFRGTFQATVRGRLEGTVTGDAFDLSWSFKMLITVRGHATGTISADGRSMSGQTHDMAGSGPFFAERID